MARNASGWKLICRRGYWRVRFTHEARRYEISTREKDRRKAAELAPQIYADIVSGRVKISEAGTLIHPGTELVELCADWLDAIKNELGEGTDETYLVYARHWARAMPVISNVTSSRIGEYQRRRLGEVRRSTVIKERGALRRFLGWCVERQVIRAVPDFPSLPKKAAGKAHARGRPQASKVLTPEECDAIIAACPEATRPFFEALHETALRPEGTLERLKPEDLTPEGLHIRPECDKNRWERTIPLTPRARAALEAGLPFGQADRRDGFARAVRRILGPGRRATAYDLKHARITELVDSGAPLGGISFLTGVSIETLTKRYAHATEREALRIVSGAFLGSGDRSNGAKGGNRTRMGVTPLAPQAGASAQNTAENSLYDAVHSAGKRSENTSSGAGPHYSDAAIREAEESIARGEFDGIEAVAALELLRAVTFGRAGVAG